MRSKSHWFIKYLYRRFDIENDKIELFVYPYNALSIYVSLSLRFKLKKENRICMNMEVGR